jgi:hypothetical protein
MIASMLPLAHPDLPLLLIVAWRLIPPRQGPDAVSAFTFCDPFPPHSPL